MPPTIADVSRKVGYSAATISRVLNNSAPVSSEVRQAVMRAARESGYLAKRSSRRTIQRDAEAAPATQVVEVVWHWHSPVERVTVSEDRLNVGPLAHTDEQALLSPGFGLSFYRSLLDGVLDELRQWGHKAVVQSNHDLLDPAFLADVNQPNKRGILLVGQFSADIARFVECCQQPLVLVDQIYRGWPDMVTIDNAGGMMSAFDHLYALGHRDIGFIGAEPDNPAFGERKMVFEWRMVQAGLALRAEWMYERTSHIQHTTEGATRILSLPHRPTALVCCNDNAALGVYRAAANCNIPIPRDLSVVGFDDIETSGLITPALTTVRVPTAQLGRQAVRQLMARRPGKPATDTDGCEIRVRTQLVERASTAALTPAAGQRHRNGDLSS